MPFWWYKSDFSRDYKAAYNLWRWMQRVRAGVITGLPGTKKTLRTLLAVTAFNTAYSVVFAFPLRQLRNEVVTRFDHEPLSQYRNRIVVIHAHDEICPELALRVKRGEPYWVALAEHLSATKEKKEECGWKQEIRKAMDALKERKVILTTHGIAVMLRLLTWAMKSRNVLFVFDEGDELFVNINDPLHVKDLEPLKQLAPKTYRRIVKLSETVTPGKKPDTALFLHSKLAWQMITSSFFITATWPKSITEWFKEYDNRIIEEYRMRGKMADDTIVLMTEQLNWCARKAWMRKLAPQLLEIASASVERFGTIAVISRNYEQTRELEQLFTSANFTVWSDRLGDNNEYDYRDVDVVILTVLGRGYRGVNFFSRRTGADFPVIVAFYQVAGPNILHPLFHFMFVDDPDDEYSEMSNFIRDLVMAKNVQALFRFNRYRTRRHLLVLLDKRWWSAINYYVSFYYRRANTVSVDIDNVSNIVVPLIKTFNPEQD